MQEAAGTCIIKAVQCTPACRGRKEQIMAEKPILVVMAAGMGSRYGGLKQIDPVLSLIHI